MSTELAIPEAVSVPTEKRSTGFEMKPRNLDEAMRFCEIMADSELVPKDYKGKPGNIMVAIQLGSELGLTPMRAMRCIAVINGRASMWGDEQLAMVLASPMCEYVRESESTDTKGVCKVKRRGDAEEHVSVFTLEDAKRAGLLGKQGPWQANTARMLKLRARGFALRDKFADVLAGLVSAEEAMDIPTDQPAAVTAQIEQPPSLKERLKAKVEVIEGAAPAQAAVSELGEYDSPKDAGATSRTGDPSPNAPSSSALDLTTAIQDAISEQEINTLMIQAHKGGLSKQDLVTIEAVARERRKQLKVK